MHNKLIEIKKRLLSHNFILGFLLATGIWQIIITIYHLMN